MLTFIEASKSIKSVHLNPLSEASKPVLEFTYLPVIVNKLLFIKNLVLFSLSAKILLIFCRSWNITAI